MELIPCDGVQFLITVGLAHTWFPLGFRVSSRFRLKAQLPERVFGQRDDAEVMFVGKGQRFGPVEKERFARVHGKTAVVLFDEEAHGLQPDGRQVHAFVLFGLKRLIATQPSPRSSPPRRRAASVPSRHSTATTMPCLTTMHWPMSNRPSASAMGQP